MTTSVHDLETLFVALDPHPALARQILDYKRTVRERVGDQLFLDHPPHLTLYLAAFDDERAVVEHMAALAEILPETAITLCGWHVFHADSLTGRNTLVCNIADESKRRMRTTQVQVVEALAPLHHEEGTRRRYARSWQHLTPEQRARVVQYGFPYFGDGWQPHFTIASIQPSDFDAIWPGIKESPPVGEYVCSRLTVYRLVNEHPASVQSFALSAAR